MGTTCPDYSSTRLHRGFIVVVLEASIVRSITSMLKKRGAWFLKVHGGPFQRPGVPDILVCLNGFFYAFEVKRPGEKATPTQEREIEAIRKAGGLAVVVTSVEEAMTILDEGAA